MQQGLLQGSEAPLGKGQEHEQGQGSASGIFVWAAAASTAAS